MLLYLFKFNWRVLRRMGSALGETNKDQILSSDIRQVYVVKRTLTSINVSATGTIGISVYQFKILDCIKTGEYQERRLSSVRDIVLINYLNLSSGIKRNV